MANGVTYENLASLELNPGETYTSCTFRNIEVLRVYDDNAISACVFESIPKVYGGFSTVDTGTTFDDCNLYLTEGSAFSDTNSVYTNCNLDVGVGSISFSGTTFTGGSISGGTVVCVAGTQYINISSTEVNASFKGQNYNLTNCTSGNIRLYNNAWNMTGTVIWSNASITNIKVRGSMDLDYMAALNIDGGDVGDLTISGNMRGCYYVKPTKMRSCSYKPGSVVGNGGYPFSRNYRYNQVPEFYTSEGSPYLYGMEGVESPVGAYLLEPYGVKSMGTGMRFEAEFNCLKVSKCHVADSYLYFSGNPEITGNKFNYTVFDHYGSNLSRDRLAIRSSKINTLYLKNNSTIRGLDLRDSQWSPFNVSGVTFENCDFRGLLLTGGTLAGCKFVNTDISGSDFTLADTTGTDFSGATNVPGSYKRNQNNLWGWTNLEPVDGLSVGPFTIPPKKAAAVAILMDSKPSLITFDQSGMEVWVACQDVVDNKSFRIASTGVLESYDKKALGKYYNSHIPSTVAGQTYYMYNRTNIAASFAARYYMVVANNGYSSVPLNISAATLPNSAHVNDTNTIALYNFLLAETGDTSVPNIAIGGGGQRNLSVEGGTLTIDPVKGFQGGSVLCTTSSMWPELSSTDWSIGIVGYLDTDATADTVMFSNTSYTSGVAIRANSSEKMFSSLRDGTTWDYVTSPTSVTLGQKFTVTINFYQSNKRAYFFYNNTNLGYQVVSNYQVPSSEFIVGAWKVTGSPGNHWLGHITEVSVSKIARSAIVP